MSTGGAVPLYDALSDDYDRFVNWEKRLAHEMPFIERTLRRADARRVIDVACGTGMHAIELAQRGYEVVGADLSAPMIERARENAASGRYGNLPYRGEVRFVVAGFGELAEKLALGQACPESFDYSFDCAQDKAQDKLRRRGQRSVRCRALFRQFLTPRAECR